MPSDSSRSRASPNHSASGGTSASSDTKTRPASDSTRNVRQPARPRGRGRRSRAPRARRRAGRPAGMSSRGTGSAGPSGSVPVPESICIARWRQTFESARSSPSSPRTTATGSPATFAVANEPGSRRRARDRRRSTSARRRGRARPRRPRVDVGARRQGVRWSSVTLMRAAPMRLRGARARGPALARYPRAVPAGRARRRARTAARRSPASSTGGAAQART